MKCSSLRVFFCAAVILMTTLGGADCQIIGPGTLTVGMTPVELRNDRPDVTAKADVSLSDYIARTVVVLLPSYIQRGFEKGLDKKVGILRVPSLAFSDSASGPTLDAIVAPSVVYSPLGVRVSAKFITRQNSNQQSSKQNAVEETVLLSPNANLGDIDDKLVEFGARVAKSVANLAPANVTPVQDKNPRGIVGLYCIVALDPQDRSLQQLARLLTIELPFHFTEAVRKRGLEVVVRGLDLKDVIANCEAPNAGSGALAGSAPIQRFLGSVDVPRIENFVWTGTLGRVAGKPKTLTLIIRSRDTGAGGNFRPLTPVTVDEATAGALPSIAKQVVDSFVQQFARSQYRIFLHFGSDTMRTKLETPVRTAFLNAGYNVVGTDVEADDAGTPSIDYFFSEDCSGAAEIRRALVESVPQGVPRPGLRLRPSTRPAGTIGIWLTSNATPSVLPSDCK